MKKFPAIISRVVLTMAICCGLALNAPAQQPADEESDVEVRTGKVTIADESSPAEVNIEVSVPSFVNRAANNITLNGADWSAICDALADCDADPFTIVHIGDSHIQADYATGVVRDMLQFDYGDAGRGLITPLKLSGTNQPTDYNFFSHELWRPQKLMKQPWKMAMGFTGTSISPSKTSTRITVGTKVTDEHYSPFVSMTLFHHGRMKINKITTEDGRELKYTDFPSKDYTQVVFDKEQTEVQVYLTAANDFALFGVSLSGDRPGVFYHTIGNNGATYSTYNTVGNIGRGIAPLQPELVIISLGTNEAFGKVNRATLYDNIDALVCDVRQANPEAQILLVTPMECQKSVYRTTTKQVKVPAKSKKGRKGKTRTVNKQVKTRTGSYTTNTSVATVRDIIKKYGEENHVAVYDWYDVAGGAGASSKWVNAGLFSKDRVHHSVKGYRLQGELLYEALKKALTPVAVEPDFKPADNQ